MQQDSRNVLVLGALTDKHVCGPEPSAGKWCFVQAPTIEAAKEILAKDSTIRVGLWSGNGESSEEEYEQFSTLRARYRLVQWLALLPAASIENTRLAAHIAYHFFDFLTAPIECERLYAWAGHAHGMSKLLERAIVPLDLFADEEQMVGTSEVMRRLYQDIRKVAASDAPIFISGESGTGKELTAKAIHERSVRSKGPFTGVDCGAIPPTLIHAELFGYEKGAFTGAGQRKVGRIEVAEGGTLFLDEIGDLPLDLQGSLLRFLQDSTIQRVGGTRPIVVNARVIAATHVDLEEAVKRGRFREDLYYRLNVLRIQVPALREREGDIEVLARYFLAQFAKDSGKALRGFTTPALDMMCRHAWPGNIRELINRVRRAIVMCDGAWVTPRDLDLERPAIQGIQMMQLDAVRDIAERQAIQQAIKMSSNNYSAAARILGVSRVTLYRLLEKHASANRPPPELIATRDASM